MINQINIPDSAPFTPDIPPDNDIIMVNNDSNNHHNEFNEINHNIINNTPCIHVIHDKAVNDINTSDNNVPNDFNDFHHNIITDGTHNEFNAISNNGFDDIINVINDGQINTVSDGQINAVADDKPINDYIEMIPLFQITGQHIQKFESAKSRRHYKKRKKKKKVCFLSRTLQELQSWKKDIQY